MDVPIGDCLIMSWHIYIQGTEQVQTGLIDKVAAGVQAQFTISIWQVGEQSIHHPMAPGVRLYIQRLNPDNAALRVYNYLHAMTLEAQLLARACGKTNIHSLEPEDLAALTMEASALAKVPLSGTNHTVGVDDFHKI